MPWAPNFRLYAEICLEGLRETTNDLSEDIQLSDEDLNPDPLKCGGTRGSVVFKARPEEMNDFNLSNPSGRTRPWCLLSL
jgi:hypothetical protein